MNTEACNVEGWVPDATNLDEMWSFNMLSRMSDLEAREMLKVNPSTFTEALSHAKGVLFLSFLQLLLDFLLEHESEDNFAAAAAFMDLIATQTELRSAEPSLRMRLHAGARRIADRQQFYGADKDIYGDFADSYKTFASAVPL
jgi:hypothetical protein